MTSVALRKTLLVLCAAVALLAAASVASAQPLPTFDAGDPVQQLMLAGEADAVSDFLGVPTDQLRSELDGQSLAQVARAHGKSVSDVTHVVVDTASQGLDSAVSTGQLSSDTASQYKSEIAFFAPFLVNSREASAQALQAVAA